MDRAVVTIGATQWQCVVADTFAELSTGLSGQESLDPNTGMLFDLGGSLSVQVTAERMLFPIDVIFIVEGPAVLPDAVEVSGGLHVLRVVTLQPGEKITPSMPCRLFMEVNEGEADGINIGDEVTVTGYAPAPEPPSLVNQIVLLMVFMMMAGMMLKSAKII